jgi:hypothetical protein
MSASQCSCGQGSCACSFLLLDLDLANSWFNTAREYFELAKKPLKDVILRQLLQPWKLSNLKEHEACFQQWNVMQLWIGVLSTIVVLAMNLIWCLAEDNTYAKPSMGSIFLNAIVGLLLVAFFTHLAWFGVINKHGCCCFIFVCCVGQPNLLVVAVLSALFGILGLITVFQAIGSVQGALIVVVLIGGIFALVHSVSLLYVGFEAAMIWKLSTSAEVSDSSETKKADVIGVTQVVTDAEAGQTKVEA